MSDALSHAQRTDRFDLRALYETSQLLSASLDLEFVLNNLLLTAMSKLLVTRGVALLYDPVEEVYNVATAKGMAHLHHGDALALPGLHTDRLLHDADVPEALEALKIVMVIPVTSGHRQIGLIGLGPKATRQPFAEQEMEFIQSLVNMSSSAVHNSLMVQELQRANRDLDNKIQQLNTLFDLSQEFNATVDRDRLVKLLSFALMGQMLVGKHLFLLGDTTAGNTNAEAASTYDLKAVSAKGVKVEDLAPALLDAFRTTDELVLIQGGDEPPEKWAGFVAHGFVLAMPIRHQGATCGMLCLGPKMTGQPYQSDDLEFLSALANLAFVSLQNSFLVDQQIEKERLEEEMRLAREIQERLQPRTIPLHPGVELATLALPSRHVAGDYFDVVPLEDGRLLVAIADVTGKGVPASLLMSNLQACLHVMVPMLLTLEEVTAHMNRVICQNTGYDKFITYFHGIFNPADRTFEYVNAGHNPPTLVRTNGDIELLETGGLLLGVMKGMPYERGWVTLEVGDVLTLFTDGVTEAMNPDGEEYEEHRLEAALKAHRHEPVQAILDAVRDEIREFTCHAPTLSDDLTMIVMKAI